MTVYNTQSYWFLDFIQRPDFGNWFCFCHQVERWDAPTQLGLTSVTGLRLALSNRYRNTGWWAKSGNSATPRYLASTIFEVVPGRTDVFFFWFTYSTYWMPSDLYRSCSVKNLLCLLSFECFSPYGESSKYFNNCTINRFISVYIFHWYRLLE
jgi:hypothetical protein